MNEESTERRGPADKPSENQHVQCLYIYALKVEVWLRTQKELFLLEINLSIRVYEQ